MIKTSELRKKSDEELNKMLKNIEYEIVKTSSAWGKKKADDKKTGTYTKGAGKQGDKTSLKRDLKKVKAKILTILNERKKNNGKM